jgi:hypothetical protein
MKRMVLAERNSSASGIWIKAMKATKHLKARFAVCVDNSEYPASLDLHKIYRVVPDEDAKKDGDLRVIDESGEDYLYPADYFLLIDIPRGTALSLNKSFARSARRVATLRRSPTP